MTHAEVKVVLGLAGGHEFGARGDAHAQTGFDDPALYLARLRGFAHAGAARAHAVIRRAPLDHVDARDGEDVLQLLDGGALLNHDGDNHISEYLDVFGRSAPPHVGDSARGNSVRTLILRGVRAHGADALGGLRGTAHIRKKDRLKTGADGTLCQELAGLLVDLDHGAQPVEFGGAADVLEREEVERRVLGHKFDIVEHTGVPDHFDDGRPGRLEVGGDGGSTCSERLAELVGPHEFRILRKARRGAVFHSAEQRNNLCRASCYSGAQSEPRMATRINWIDWVCIGLYSIALFGIAYYHSHKMKRQDDMYLAGRSMSKWPIAMSMYMALFSTNTFLGSTGWVNRPNGTVWIGLQSIGAMLAVPLVVSLYPTLFYRLRITSAYEYLEKRFSPPVRSVATSFFLASRVMWMGTMLYSSGLVLSTMLGWTGPGGTLASILAIGIFSTLFTLLGGMHAVIWTDVMQFFVLVFSLIGMIAFGLALSGGIGEVIRVGQEYGRFTTPSFFSLTDELSLMGGLLLGFVGMLSSAGADQVVLQQYLTAKSDVVAKASLWRNGLCLKPMSLVYPFLGLIMFAYYRAHPDIAGLMRIPDDALPVFVVNVLPPGMRGLMIVAMIAAVLTSIQSGLAAVSAAVQVNYIQPRLKRPLSDRASVFLARSLLLSFGVIILLAAAGLRPLGQKNSIIQILNIAMYPFAGVLLGIFLLGILSHRANAQGALCGGVFGFLATVAVPLSRMLLPPGAGPPVVQHLGKISDFYYGFLGALTTLAAGYAVSLLTAPPPESKIKGLTRRSLPEAPAAGGR